MARRFAFAQMDSQDLLRQSVVSTHKAEITATNTTCPTPCQLDKLLLGFTARAIIIDR